MVACGPCILSSSRNCSKYFLACRYHQGDFVVSIFLGIWHSATHSLERFLKIVIMKLQALLPPSHHHEGDILTAAHSHSHVLFWLPEVLLMHFHYQVILIPLVALPSNSESCHWRWWVISLFAWPFLDRSNTVALVPDRLGVCVFVCVKLASALENSSILFSVYGVASNTIVHCSLFLLLYHKTFWHFCRVINPAKEMASELHLPTIPTFWWIGREMRKQWL